jgi:hypothetical protein
LVVELPSELLLVLLEPLLSASVLLLSVPLTLEVPLVSMVL